MTGDPRGYITPESLAILKKNTEMSPHTWRVIMDPIHAYLCDGSCNVLGDYHESDSNEDDDV